MHQKREGPKKGCCIPGVWPVRPEPPFNTDGDVIFRYHFDAPDHEVSSYHKFLLYMQGTPESVLKIIDGCWGKI